MERDVRNGWSFFLSGAKECPLCLKPCQFMMKGCACPHGDNCSFSHDISYRMHLVNPRQFCVQPAQQWCYPQQMAGMGDWAGGWNCNDPSGWHCDWQSSGERWQGSWQSSGRQRQSGHERQAGEREVAGLMAEQWAATPER